MAVRCYLPPEAWGGEEVILTGREAHHLKDVLRVKTGSAVTCFDGAGQTGDGHIVRLSRREVVIALGKRSTAPPPALNLHLGMAIPGQGKLEPMINQATQLGVRSILPLITERTVVRIPSNRADQKRERLNQVAIEAVKQSGLLYLPHIHSIQRWSDFVGSVEGYDLILIASVSGPHERLTDLLSGRAARKLLILIGPEGDWADQEIAEAVAKGAKRFSLGPTVLRCDTAAVAALAIVSALLRERTQKGSDPCSKGV